jgi:hypothetical protein
MTVHPNNYYVITSRRGEHPDRWAWEIRRKSKPLGIKMTEDGYQSLGRAICGEACSCGFSVGFIERGEGFKQVRAASVGGNSG